MTQNTTDHYDEHNDEPVHRSKGKLGGFLSGVMLGGLIGGTVALFLAPRSGRETLERIRLKGEVLRDQATLSLYGARDSAEHLVTDVTARVDTLQQRGRELVQENKERIERTAAAVKATAKETWAETQPDHRSPVG